MEKIESFPVKFKIVKQIKNSMNGVETESILLEYDGADFVYVPGGKNVLLGWDVDNCQLGEGVIAALRNYQEEGVEYCSQELEDCKEGYLLDIKKAEESGKLEEAERIKGEMQEDLASIAEEMHETFEVFMEEWNGHLKKCMSPLRKADIKPMIVEVNSRYIEKPINFEEFMKELSKTPFTVPTEDEWEYLCNGGTRTLLRWGDSLDKELNEMFQTGTRNSSKPEKLTQPNMFGLLISYNSYKMELIHSPDFVKGGDGGSSLCGGDGLIYVLPAFTAFYRSPLQDYPLSENYYSYRRIITLDDIH